jgi:hypothetical protein
VHGDSHVKRANPNSMTKSKNKSKPAPKSRPAPSRFAATAQRAIRKAQQSAARENARFGLPLIVLPPK